MFGYVTTDIRALPEEERECYRSHYCGLCHTLRGKYGKAGTSSLSYDMVFLELVLSDLTDSAENTGCERCLAKPFKSHCYTVTGCTEYASDMQMLLRYYSDLDSVLDEGKGERREKRLRPFMEDLEEAYPRQSAALRTHLGTLREGEKAGIKDPEMMSLESGRFLGEVFVMDEDSFFRDDLRALGCGLGRFVYLLDAWCDRRRDKRHGSYNPFSDSVSKDEARDMLLDAAASASFAFERLPLDQHVFILGNILYSGIWLRFERGKKDE